MRTAIITVYFIAITAFTSLPAFASYGYFEVDPNPASISEYYTVYYVFHNSTSHDITVYYVKDGESIKECNVIVSAGNTEVLYSASGTTYTPGEFYHHPVFYTSDGTFEGDPYVFVVK